MRVFLPGASTFFWRDGVMTVSNGIFHRAVASLSILAAVPAFAAGSTPTSAISPPSAVAIVIHSADGRSCSVSAHDLAEALQGRSSACNRQMGEVLRVNAHGIHHNAFVAHRDIRSAKPLYDHAAWFSRPKQSDEPTSYFGQRVD